MTNLFEFKDILFWTGFVLLLISIAFHSFQKTKPALLLLVGAGFLFFLYAALLIPILNVWDERFHALVAKNFLKHPFKPTLYNEDILKLPYTWVQTHIWVHKQPLFMWQAALSYKLFGISEFAFRFPGVLLCTGVIGASYRIGKLLGNTSTGYSIAFLIATSLYVEQLISGFAPLDQNDLVFMAYISLSIWSMTEFIFSGKFYWVILTGIFSGCALLTKEAVGLLVYLIWFIYILLTYKFRIKSYLPMICSLLISLAIFLPWQLFIFHNYPVEAKTEYQFNLRHFSEAVDGQGGPFSHHFAYIGLIFGSLVPYLIIPGLIIFYIKSTNKKLSFSIIFSLVFLYIFFSFAKTKMQSFTTVAEIPMYLSIAFLISASVDFSVEKLKLSAILKTVFVAIVFISIAFSRFDFNSLKTNDGFWGKDIDCFNRLKHNKEVFQRLKLPDNAVLFNVPGRHYVEAMYYTNFSAYGFIPTESQSNEVRSKGKRIVLFRPLENKLPDYLAQDKNLIILNDSLGICE